jgi:hypothetical protein
MKLKRRVIHDMYATEIDRLYAPKAEDLLTDPDTVCRAVRLGDGATDDVQHRRRQRMHPIRWTTGDRAERHRVDTAALGQRRLQRT